MAKYGLAQVDFNLLVQMSLAGLIDAPEHHLSNLLRSPQPIEARTRQALADALSGRLPASKIKVTQTKQVVFVRRFRKLRQQIKIGQQVSEVMRGQSLSYDDAVEAIAAKYRGGEKSVQRAYTHANKLQRWLEECRKLRLNHSDAALEMAYIYSTLKGIDVADGLKPTVEHLAELVYRFEQAVSDASGLWADV